MLKFHPYSILTGDTRVEFVIFCVLNLNWGSDFNDEQFLGHCIWDPLSAFPFSRNNEEQTECVRTSRVGK